MHPTLGMLCSCLLNFTQYAHFQVHIDFASPLVNQRRECALHSAKDRVLARSHPNLLKMVQQLLWKSQKGSQLVLQGHHKHRMEQS